MPKHFPLGRKKGKMPKFRKRPVVVEAICWNATADAMIKLQELNTLRRKTWIEDFGLMIETLEGVHRADLGDWIIQGVNGEIYPCKPDIFHKTYEPVEDNEEK